MVLQQYCRQCEANCCKNWTIFTTIADIKRIADFTGQNIVEFAEFSKIPDWEVKYYSKKIKFHFYNLAKSGFILQLKKHNNHCLFLHGNKCQIYKVRPYICRLYHFWFLRKRNCFEIITCIGYKNVCIIPENVLNSYLKENEQNLIFMVRKYYQEIQDYKARIKSFVKKYFKGNVLSI